MGVHSEIPDNKKVDHLILLVGGNPLPNAVAGRLLVQDTKTSKITLIHSKGENSTKPIADNLQAWFVKQGMPSKHILLDEVDASNKHDICRVIEKQVEQATGHVGLNYTGGTKTMAVHAYTTVLAKEPNAVMSYLDALSLCMIFDDHTSRSIVTHSDINLSINDLFELHGWEVTDATQPQFDDDAKITANLSHYGNNGFQFENDVAQQLLRMKLPLTEVLTNVKAILNGNLAEFDIVALYGYQLFFLSCTITNPQKRRNRNKIKQKLIESFVRARQLGGDEACASLVCFVDDSELVEENDESTDINLEQSKVSPTMELEVQQLLQVKGRVRVFGRKHLPKLAKHLERWIKEQSRYGKECS